ncbi:phage protein [uncultured Mediterranean phage uvMED]|nr:phage protein [uncultured Mediterranean phage uvMED]BAR20982.1 phage protein [uncultured Mediterranean phage uvMED]
MARQIRLDQIDDVMKEAVEDLVAATTLEWTARVKKATPVRVVYEGEPKGGGQLRAAWQTEIKPLEGTIINNLAYAEPVCFGTNLPPSWGKVYRTRQKTVAGFPELIGKELEQYARREYEKIKRGI